MIPTKGGARRRAVIVSGAALLALAPASAQETISYTYDARGRLVQVDHQGGANDGVNSSYSYDAADNRTNVTIATGNVATSCSGIGFAVGNNSASEGASLSFTVTKAGTTADSCSVGYATTNGTAAAGSDYTARSGSLTFGSAQTSLTVSVATTNDTTVESAETVLLNLSGPSGAATISDSQGVGTINDNDVADPCSGVSFTVGNASVTEGGTLSFTVSKTGAATGSCSVGYASVNGTAAAGSDYTAKSGTLTFSSTQTSLTVSVATINDTTVENAETVLLNLSNATGGATIGDSQGVGTINDNDTAGVCGSVSFSVNNVSAVEADPLVFTVTKAGTTSASCSISYATANGSATASSGDYTAASGTLTFTSTQTTKTVSVATSSNAHLRAESNEYMFLNLSGATDGATISDSQGTGTIIDDGVTSGGGCTLCVAPAGSPDAGTADAPTDSTTTTTDPTTTEPPPPADEPPAGEMSSLGVSPLERRVLVAPMTRSENAPVGRALA